MSSRHPMSAIPDLDEGSYSDMKDTYLVAPTKRRDTRSKSFALTELTCVSRKQSLSELIEEDYDCTEPRCIQLPQEECKGDAAPAISTTRGTKIPEECDMDEEDYLSSPSSIIKR